MRACAHAVTIADRLYRLVVYTASNVWKCGGSGTWVSSPARSFAYIVYADES